MEDLKDKLEQAERETINLKFQRMEEKLTEIKELLENFIKTNHKDHDDRIKLLEDTQKLCGINDLKTQVAVYKSELKRFGRETSLLRAVFNNPIKGIVIISLWMALILYLLALVGAEPILKIITLIK